MYTKNVIKCDYEPKEPKDKEEWLKNLPIGTILEWGGSFLMKSDEGRYVFLEDGSSYPNEKPLLTANLKVVPQGTKLTLVVGV